MTVHTANAVTDARQRQRFELEVGGAKAFIDYHRAGNVVTLTYAYVPPDLRGRGVGAALVAGALELVRERAEKIIPQCAYVAAYIARHPHDQALLVDRADVR
ncbi:MAG: GNAT family N-acetyltransferase [Steroidobacteraceae bacterium]